MISISKLCTAYHQNSIRFSGWKLSKKINSNKKKGRKLFWLLAVWSIITPQEKMIPFLTTSLSLNKVSMPMVKWILLGSWNILASIPRLWNNNIVNYASVITSTEIKVLRDGCPSSLQWQILARESPEFKSSFTQQLGFTTLLIFKPSSRLPPASWNFSLTCHIVSYVWATVDIVYNPYKYYSWLSLDGHLYKTDTFTKWTPRVGLCLSLLPLLDSL